MRVFILSTGRTGSMAIIRACEHITNYSCRHESRTKIIGEERLSYPDNHIESDNRLSWFLGSLDRIYGDSAIYVHLIRNKEKTVSSYLLRWNALNTIVKSFADGILNTPSSILNDEKKKKVVSMYYDTVNDNISLFTKSKKNTLVIRLENIKEDFEIFWNTIGAEGNLDLALKEFDKLHNKSKYRKINLRYRLKIIFFSIFKR